MKSIAFLLYAGVVLAAFGVGFAGGYQVGWQIGWEQNRNLEAHPNETELRLRVSPLD